MAKQSKGSISQEGEIIEALSNARYKVKLDNGCEVNCCLSGKMRQNFIRVIPGDIVTVDVGVYDLTQGRITGRKRSSQSSQTPVKNNFKVKKK